MAGGVCGRGDGGGDALAWRRAVQAGVRPLLKPRGWLKPNVLDDDPRQHLFAQGLGGVFLVLSTAALLLGLPLLGWALAGAVVVLAAINLFLGFCLGCFIYFQLGRRG
jgi:hypothetical protein